MSSPAIDAKFSIYTTAYNLKAGMFDWRAAIGRFAEFADQVVIATNTPEDYQLLNELASDKVKVLLFNIPFSDYAFDGKLKNAALQACDYENCILLDLDEYIPLSQKQSWVSVAYALTTYSERFEFRAFLIPSISLFNSEYEYKDISFKFYLHKKAGCFRGVVNYAKQEDGKININKSDTTELIDEHGELVPSRYVINPNVSDEQKLNTLKHSGLYVLHTGWLDKNVRLAQNAFWKPHWENRSGAEVTNIILENDKLSEINYSQHGLTLC